jgi:uncharacterized protein YkwD
MRPGVRAAIVLWLLLTLFVLLTAPRPAEAAGEHRLPVLPSGQRPARFPSFENEPPWPGSYEETPGFHLPGLAPRMEGSADIAAASPAQQLLALINQVRWEHGQIPPLKANLALQRAARAHSQSMAQNDFFGHKGDDLSSPWDRIDAAGYGNWYVLAENIAAGCRTPQEALQAWMSSPRHRENLLSTELAEAGIGYVWEPGDTYPGITWGYQHYWTLDMGTRWDAFPLVIAGEAYSTTTPQVSIYFYGQGWATEMRLSNDRSTWSPWRPYQPTTAWELSLGTGIKHVYGQLRNAQGGLMQASDEIVLAEKPNPPAPPAPFVSPAQAIFIVQEGRPAGQPAQYCLQITETGPTTYPWQASLDQNWLYLSAISGTSPASITLALSDTVRLLAPGTYTATISFQGHQAQATIPVQLIVMTRVYSVYLPAMPGRR